MDVTLPRPTAATLRAMKQRGEKIAVLTAYDYPTARLLDECGVDVLLVGDSLGMVVLGYPDTTHVTIAEMEHHTRAVARGTTHAMIWSDLPIHTFDTPEQAVENARRLVAAGAHAIKLEGGRSHVPQIAALVSAGIPAIAHIGMMPQRVKEEGGYRIKGKTPEQADALLTDALAVETAGAFAVLLALTDGRKGLLLGADHETEYLANLDIIPGACEFVRSFVTDIDRYSVHVRGHPPGFLLILDGFDAIGLVGAWPVVALSLAATTRAPSSWNASTSRRQPADSATATRSRRCSSCCSTASARPAAAAPSCRPIRQRSTASSPPVPVARAPSPATPSNGRAPPVDWREHPGRPARHRWYHRRP